MMTMEIVYTVAISLESHTLNAEPFLLIGVIAGIRRMLVITATSTQAEGNAAQFHNTLVELGLSLENFVMENISLPDELQKMLDQRISMNMLGDMNKYTQFQVAQSMPIAAGNEGGGAAGIEGTLGVAATGACASASSSATLSPLSDTEL